MKQLFSAIFFFFFLFAAHNSLAQDVKIAASEVHNGFFVKDFPLKTFARPEISITGLQFSSLSLLPKGIVPDAASHFSFSIGRERKQAFVRVKIPVFSKNSEGNFQTLSSFSIKINEAENATPQLNASKTAKTTGAASPLASGTWYKIAVVDRGVYKIDYDFIKSMGVDPATINTANIRMVGNYGGLIDENNAVEHPIGLTDISTWVNDGGDGKINSGDFIAFYARGNMRWDKDSTRQRFVHVKNIYADSSYCFLSFDAGNGRRITKAATVNNPNIVVNSFNDYSAHEEDFYNPGQFGKEWWGEKFGLGSMALPARTFTFPLHGIIDSVFLRASVASRSIVGGNQMSLAVNGVPTANYYFGAVSLEADQNPVSTGYSDIQIPVNASSADVLLSYNASSDAIGYLNYLELNWRRNLSFDGDNFSFRDWKSVGPGLIASFQIANAPNTCQVWDVTNPVAPTIMTGSLNGSTYSFNQNAEYLHEFVALTGNNFSKPFFVKKIENQNLMGRAIPTFTIVTFPAFLDAANSLADYHRAHDGMNVLVATTEQVYNEFSSGGQDISGIRDMMRYYYREGGNDTSLLPKYLLLFGDASYDYKNRIDNNSNYVPTFESVESVNVDGSYTVDDFFGFLDDNENMSNYSIPNTLDIGIGRIPVNSATQASDAVNKILAYSDPKSLGPWRLNNTYIGDNEDYAGHHAENAETIAAEVQEKSPFSNESKIYLDNLPFVSTPGGERCPDANKAINDQIFKGTFLMNYTGHGSTSTLAHERILTKEDFSKWQNLYKLPFMVTATCDYARYDNPAYVSNGEQMILEKNGGTIAMLTTTGPVYAGTNTIINQQFLATQYTKENGNWPTFGDAIRIGKNITFRQGADPGTLLNFYRFTLLGDPALQPAFPKHVIHTDSIKVLGTDARVDTLKALGNYTVNAHISTDDGTPINDFNGRAYITIFDKKRHISTFTKPNGEIQPPIPVEWDVRDNVIFKGITTVTNGKFSFSFIAPKDMDYNFGGARISYYAENGITDAAGMDTTVQAGGFQDGVIADNDAPIVKPYIGDTLFRDGGVTGSNTLLYVKLSDESGINASGNAVGHDITAVLDGDDQNPYILNDYYETEPNTYKAGHVSFPISGLANGKHKLTVKAWDVFNNSGTGEVNFIVSDGKVVNVDNLINYPNPFGAITHFFFEHNHPDEELNVQISVYDMKGMLVRTISQNFTPSGSHSNEIEWDGRGDSGALLPNGVYPYRFIVSTPSGIKGTAYQKLIILR